jgi:hypothetical protein
VDLLGELAAPAKSLYQLLIRIEQSGLLMAAVVEPLFRVAVAEAVVWVQVPRHYTALMLAGLALQHLILVEQEAMAPAAAFLCPGQAPNGVVVGEALIMAQGIPTLLLEIQPMGAAEDTLEAVAAFLYLVEMAVVPP